MYSLQAPKFCGGCGKGLSILSAAKQTSSTSPSPSAKLIKKKLPSRRLESSREEEYDPDGLDINEIPVISKLSYSIEKDKNSFNLKDLIPLEQFEEFKEEVENKPKKRRGRPRKK